MYEYPLFPIADTLQMNLTLGPAPGHVVSGQTVKMVDLGPWKAKTWNTVYDDALDKDRAAVLVKIRKSLWLYVVTYAVSPQSDVRVWVHIVDGKEAGLTMASAGKYGTGDPFLTLAQLGKAVKKTLTYKVNRWVPCEPSDMEQGLPVKDPVSVVASAEGFPG